MKRPLATRSIQHFLVGALAAGAVACGQSGGRGGAGGMSSTGAGGVVGHGGHSASTEGAGGTSSRGGSAGSAIAAGGVVGAGGRVERDGGGQAETGGVDLSTGGAARTGGAGGAGGVTGRGGAIGATGGAGGSGIGAAGARAGGATGSGGVRLPDAGGAVDSGGSASVGATPPMGWNSWNTFECKLDEQLIEGVADAMVSSGMAAAGYRYVNLDDCWMSGRDASGNLQWDTSKFPKGIPALADYIHGKGLELGIYETPNTTTCVGLYQGISKSVAVGSLGHETQDAMTFAAWGIDYLKYDLCQGQRTSFAKMRDALAATGRPIFYSINPGNGSNDLCPPSTCSLDLPSIANMWRIGFDINASWSSVVGLIDQNAGLSKYAGPGHWNDPDMLEVGKGMSADEDRAHFSMWAMLAAPLLAGNDIRSMSASTKAILTNPDVIVVDQDPRGVQGTLVASPGTNLQVWSKPLSGSNTCAVALLNRGDVAASLTVTWSSLGLPAGAATVRDLWSQSDLGSFTDAYTASSVPKHGVVMLKIHSGP